MHSDYKDLTPQGYQGIKDGVIFVHLGTVYKTLT